MVTPKPQPTRVAVAPPQEPAARLFRVGHDLDYPAPSKIKKARVWAHPRTVESKTGSPLLIYLHGNNAGSYLNQQFPQLFGPPTEPDKYGEGSTHIGEILRPWIDKNQVAPLIVACPTMIANGASMWRKEDFDLSKFITAIAKLLDDIAAGTVVDADHPKVKIDYNRVAVTAHSGGGGNPGAGLGNVADGGAQFTVGGTTYPLKILGISDTKVDADVGAAIRDGLKKANNTTTTVYAVFRSGGAGWGHYDSPGFWQALTGQSGKKAHPFVPNDRNIEDSTLMVKSQSFGDDPAMPVRHIAIALNVHGESPASFHDRWNDLPKEVHDPGSPRDWTRAWAYRHYKGGFDGHFAIVGIWSEWVTQRYFTP